MDFNIPQENDVQQYLGFVYHTEETEDSKPMRKFSGSNNVPLTEHELKRRKRQYVHANLQFAMSPLYEPDIHG